MKVKNAWRGVISGVMVVGLMGAGGCASLVSGSREMVWVNSIPQGATVRVLNNNGYEVAKATTPARVKLRRAEGYFHGAKYTYNFKADGYEPRVETRSASINPWYFSNLLLGAVGGLPGMVVFDPLIGGMWSLDDHVLVRLRPIQSSDLASKGSVSLTDVLRLKDGSIIRGQLMEIQPGKQYRIRRGDGSEQVFQAESVESVERGVNRL